MNKNYFLLIVTILLSSFSRAQVPVVTAISGPGATCTFPSPATLYNASASNNPTSYSWYVVPSNGVTILNGTTANASISFGGAAGNYTIYCSASNGSGSGSPLSTVVSVFETPSVTFSGNTNLFCQGSSTNLQASPTIYSASSTLSYSWTPSTGLSTTTGSAVVASPQVSTNYTVLLTMGICKNTAQIFVNVNPFLINISPPSVTVCNGSSANLSASGSTSYTWSTGANSASINVLPTVSTNYSVFAIDTNGCPGSKAVAVTVDNTCSDVWPGDANSDGVVNSSDILELGYYYLGTGPARSVTGNNYTPHFASNWSGIISNGKNRAHADCNGDGVINLADTVAIYNNYLMTHAFRTSSSTGDAITLLSNTSNMVKPGEWNKLDIVLGEENSQVNIYGLAFDINYDETMIETGQAYVKFTPSFLNNNNQNVEFRKVDANLGKIYIADIRTDGAEVSGNGKIGEFYFKVKPSLSEGVVINMSISNTQKARHDHSLEPLSGNLLPLSVNKNPVSVGKIFATGFNMFPNPVSDKLIIQTGTADETNYTITDISGRVVLNGTFIKTATISTSGLAAGSYNIRLNSVSGTSTHKLLVK